MKTDIKMCVHITIIVITSLIFSIFLQPQIILIGLALIFLYLIICMSVIFRNYQTKVDNF